MTSGDDRRWIVDGNNVYGSRPDGWWNDRQAAATRLAQRIAEWCRTHGEEVTIVFDAPVTDETSGLGGGNLAIEAAPRRGRDAADDRIAELASSWSGDAGRICVVTSDRGLRRRLPVGVEVMGVGAFRSMIGY